MPIAFELHQSLSCIFTNLPNLIYLYTVVKGLPCNMTVPWNCRNVPTTHVEALPLTADGKCKADPKISDVPKICTYNQWVNINISTIQKYSRF